MKLSNQIKPISYLKSHAAEIVRKLDEKGERYTGPLQGTNSRRYA